MVLRADFFFLICIRKQFLSLNYGLASRRHDVEQKQTGYSTLTIGGTGMRVKKTSTEHQNNEKASGSWTTLWPGMRMPTSVKRQHLDC